MPAEEHLNKKRGRRKLGQEYCVMTSSSNVMEASNVFAGIVECQ